MLASLIGWAAMVAGTAPPDSRIDWSWAYDGSRILGRDGKYARLWDASTGELLQTFGGLTDSINEVSFVPGDTQIVTASGGGGDVPIAKPNLSVELWDIRSGRLLRHFDGLTGSVQTIDFSPDAKRVLCVESGGGVIEWNLATGGKILTFDGAYSPVMPPSIPPVTFSPDGSKLLVSGGRSVSLRDSTTGTSMVTFSDPDETLCYVTSSFAADGRQVLTTQMAPLGNKSGLKHSATLWNASTGAKIRDFARGDGQIVGGYFDGTGSDVAIVTEREVQIWDPTSGMMRKAVALPEGFVLIAPSPDRSRCLIRQGISGTLIWDSRTRELVAKVPDTSHMSAGPVGFSPDCDRFLTRDLTGYGEPQSISIWQSNSGKRLRTVRLQSFRG